MYISGYSFTWEIENPSFYRNKCLTSPKFTFKGLSPNEWFLNFFPRGCNAETETFFSCFLCYKNGGDIPSQFFCVIDITGSSGQMLQKGIFRQYFRTRTHVHWGNSKFLSNLEFSDDFAKSGKDVPVLIINCMLFGKNSVKKELGASTAFSRVDVDMHCFNLSGKINAGKIILPEYKNRFINEDTKFVIRAKDDEIKIRRISNSEYSKLCFYECKLTTVNAEGRQVSCQRMTRYITELDSKYTWPIILTNEGEAISDTNVNSIILKVLISYSALSYSGIITRSITSEETGYNTVTEIPSLSNDMLAIFRNEEFTDVKFRMENQVISAHKCVLVARSPVFKAMFDQDMVETQMGIVDIIDIDPNIMNLFLQFLYTDFVDKMDYEVAKNLLIVADKYQVLSLKEKCVKFIKCDIALDTVCEILALSNAINHVNLKSSAISFITENSESILSSPQWKLFLSSHTELASEILSTVSLDLSHKRKKMRTEVSA